MAVEVVVLTVAIICSAFAVAAISPRQSAFDQTKLGQRKYASHSTDELKLRRNQIVEMLGTGNGERIDIKIGSPMAMAMMDDDGKVEDLFKEKNEFERELLRRWKAGDQTAKIESFSSL